MKNNQDSTPAYQMTIHRSGIISLIHIHSNGVQRPLKLVAQSDEDYRDLVSIARLAGVAELMYLTAKSKNEKYTITIEKRNF